MKEQKGPETKTDGALVPAKKLVPISVLARRWSVSDTTIKRLIEEGELKGIRIRRAYRVFMESVVEYEARSRF